MMEFSSKNSRPGKRADTALHIIGIVLVLMSAVSSSTYKHISDRLFYRFVSKMRKRRKSGTSDYV